MYFTGRAFLQVHWYGDCLVYDKWHFLFISGSCIAALLHTCLIICLSFCPCAADYTYLCAQLCFSPYWITPFFPDLFSNMPRWFLILILFQVCRSSQFGVICISDKDAHYLVIQWLDLCWTLLNPFLYFYKDTFFLSTFSQPVLYSLLKVISLGHVSLNLTWNEMVPEMYQNQDTRSLLLCLYPQDLLQD